MSPVEEAGNSVDPLDIQWQEIVEEEDSFRRRDRDVAGIVLASF